MKFEAIKSQCAFAIDLASRIGNKNDLLRFFLLSFFLSLCSSLMIIIENGEEKFIKNCGHVLFMWLLMLMLGVEWEETTAIFHKIKLIKHFKMTLKKMLWFVGIPNEFEFSFPFTLSCETTWKMNFLVERNPKKHATDSWRTFHLTQFHNHKQRTSFFRVSWSDLF